MFKQIKNFLRPVSITESGTGTFAFKNFLFWRYDRPAWCAGFFI